MKMRVTRRHLPLIAALLVFGKTVARAGASHEVTIDKLVYTPGSISIQVGETVTWVNHDPIDHTATFQGDATASAWEVMIPAG
ncbi:MAG: plastocyanin/azurin family copper-binding protein, partial [Aestuariivirga sp.]